MTTKTELEQYEEELEVEAEAGIFDMPTFEHGIICINLSGELQNFLKGKNLGRLVDGRW